jgi:anaerobic selenocysteine-containing dehydrogenase
VAPPPGVRSDLEIMQGLAARVGLGQVMAGSAREWKERLLASKMAPHGITADQLERGAVRNPLAPNIVFADRRFATPTGRVNLVTSEPAPAALAADGYPLVLMSISTDRAQSSQWAAPAAGPAVATVHPAAAGGLADGALARLESRVSSLVVRIAHDPAQRRDVVLVPKGGHRKDGRCANSLVQARTTDLGEGGALYDERVRIVPLAE